MSFVDAGEFLECLLITGLNPSLDRSCGRCEDKLKALKGVSYEKSAVLVERNVKRMERSDTVASFVS